MSRQQCDTIVLAAGLSSRLGTFKPLLKINNKTLIETVLQTVAEISEKIIVVTGHEHQKLESLINQHKKVQIAHNSNYKQGMFASIKRGLKEVTGSKFFITLVDMPFIKSSTFKTLLEESINTDSHKILRPSYKGKTGHPVLFNSSLIPEIMALPDNSSLRDFVEKNNFLNIDVEDEGILIDIDTMQDYSALVKAVF